MRDAPSVADIKREANRSRRQEADHRRARQGAAADIFETERKTCEPDPGQHKAAAVKRTASGLFQIADQHVDERDAQYPNRDVDKENPAP